MRQFLKTATSSLSREPLVLFTALTLVVGTWGFIAVADEVLEGDTQAFDEWVVLSMRRADDPAQPIGPQWLAEVGRDATALGGVFTLVLVATAVAGYLLVLRAYRMLILLLAATSSGITVSLMLKQVFSRPRPDVVPHLSHVYTSSFPSGHSMMSAVVYLTLAAIVSATIRQRSLKVYVFAVAFTVVMAIGVSRIYMGVHYPTDVLAGWVAGIVWALASWNLISFMSRRGDVETPDVDQVK